MAGSFAPGYVEALKKRRARSSPISRGYQVTGLMITDLLRDRLHKHLYLKLAREYDNGALLTLARDVAERKGISNYGAYFMRRFQQTKATMRRTSSARRTQRKLPLRKKRTTR